MMPQQLVRGLAFCLLINLPVVLHAQADKGAFFQQIDGRLIAIDTMKNEHLPSMAGNLDKFLSDHARYPDQAIESGYQGKVIVRFKISSTGQIDSISVFQSSGHSVLDNEVIRLVKSLPALRPATKDGIAVPAVYILPFTFALDNGPENSKKKRSGL